MDNMLWIFVILISVYMIVDEIQMFWSLLFADMFVSGAYDSNML